MNWHCGPWDNSTPCWIIYRWIVVLVSHRDLVFHTLFLTRRYVTNLFSLASTLFTCLMLLCHQWCRPRRCPSRRSRPRRSRPRRCRLRRSCPCRCRPRCRQPCRPLLFAVVHVVVKVVVCVVGVVACAAYVLRRPLRRGRYIWGCVKCTHLHFVYPLWPVTQQCWFQLQVQECM